MSARRGWIALALLAVGIVVAVAVWRAIRLRSAAPEGEVTSEVPVRVGKVARATLRRYVVTFGTVEPEPAQATRPAAGARAASAVLCSPSYAPGAFITNARGFRDQRTRRKMKELLAKEEVACSMVAWAGNFERYDLDTSVILPLVQ